MATPEQVNHAQEGIDRLPSQWGRKYTVDIEQPNTKVQALLESLLKPLNGIEELAFAVRNAYNINTSVGVQLDTFGEILNLKRQGYNDEEYRVLLINKIAAGNGSGTIDQVQNLLQNLTNFADTNLWEHYPLGYIITSKSDPRYTFGKFLKDASAAGVDSGYVGFDPFDCAFIPAEGVITVADLTTEEGDQITTEGGDNIQVETLVLSTNVSERNYLPDASDSSSKVALAPICQLDVQPPSGGGYGDLYGFNYGGGS